MPSVPRQYEFARLNLTYTVLSKRVLKRLVDEGHVRGWDDPRMPTIAGLRRRGFPAEGIRDFAAMIGVAKTDAVIEVGQLEFAVRAVLNRTAQRRFGVLDPLKVVITNYPAGKVEAMEVVNNPEDPGGRHAERAASRGELWIERDDFLEEPPPKFFRLAPGREVRLRNAYFITCREVVKDAAGRVVELRCDLRPGHARRRRRPTAGGPRRRSTGCRRRMPCRPRCGCTTTCSAARTRAPTATSSRTSTRRPRRSSPARCVEPALGRGVARRDGPVRAPRLLHAGPGLAGRVRSVFNRTLTLKDTWAKVQAQDRSAAGA